MDNLLHIHIFKTDIRKENLFRMSTIFANHQSISHWNVDTDDCDFVLRVVSEKLSENDIITLVSQSGFKCEVLD